MSVEIGKEDGPGVYREETNEASIKVTPLGTRNVANVGVFGSGRTNARILITSQDYLVPLLGEGDFDKYGADWYGLSDLLEETNRIYAVRVTQNPTVDADKMKYSGLLLDGASGSSAYPIDEMSTTEVLSDTLMPVGKGNTSDFILPLEKANVGVGELGIYALSPSADGDNIGVRISSNNVDISVVVPAWTSTPLTVLFGELYKDANGFVWQAMTSGTVGTVEPTWPTAPEYGELVIDGDVTWININEDDEKDVLSLKDKYPNSWKIMHKIEVYEKSDSATVFGSSYVEEYYVTFDETVAPSGLSLFVKEVINGTSEYIYVNMTPIEITSHASYDGTLYDTIVSNESTPIALSGGQDGNFTKYSSDYITQMKAGWALFKSREYVQWNLAFVPTDASLDATFQIAKQANVMASYRVMGLVVSQCDTVGDVRKEQVVMRSKSAFSGLADATRIAYYAGYDRRFDTYKGKRIYLPKAIEGARAILKTSRIKNDFDAPSGADVATCKGFSQNVEWTREDMGYLYARNINVAITKSGVSVLWGQKTAKLDEEPRDRINVRRALDKIGQDLEQKGDTLIWTSISPKLVERLYSLLDRDLGVKEGTGYFNTLKGTGYRIVIDTSNASSNRLDAKVQVKIVSTLEWLGIEIAVTDDSVELTESA